MHASKVIMILLNVVGGAAVLGSYAHGFANKPDSAAALWGGVPTSIQPLYTVTMLLAAAGYFLFASFILLRLDPERTRIGGRFGYGTFNLLYALILFPSALWMPMTFLMIEQPGTVLWIGIRLVLALVGIGSLGLLGSLLTLDRKEPRTHYWLAIAGACAFCVQTALLDALVWPAYFPAAH